MNEDDDLKRIARAIELLSLTLTIEGIVILLGLLAVAWP